MTKQLPYRVISLTKPKAGLAFSSLQHQGIKASLPCSDLIHAPLNVYRSRLCDGDSANTDGLISEALAFKNHFCLFNFFPLLISLASPLFEPCSDSLSLNSGWHGQCSQGCSCWHPPPPRLILRSANEPCRLILCSAVYLTNRFCGLWVPAALINPRSRWRLVIRFKFHTCGSKEVRILAFRVDPHPSDLSVNPYIKLPREQARRFSCWCLPANDFSPFVINHVSIL